MTSQILINPELDSRIQFIEQVLGKQNLTKQHPDVLWFDDSAKIGIEQAKEIRDFLMLKAYSAKSKAVVLESAHNLTVEAQNSLLKTLEEPPENALILLGVDSESKLLPTILSRCQIVPIEDRGLRIEDSDKKDRSWKIEEILNSSLGERFQFIEKLEEKEEFLNELVRYFREKMHKDPKNAKFAKLLVQAQEWEKSNVNLRAILEYLMLQIN